MLNWYLGLSTALISILFVMWKGSDWPNMLIKITLFALAMLGFVLNLIRYLAVPELLGRIG